MIRFDFTHPDPWYNIAIDEALLETAEAASASDQKHAHVLRIWEPENYAVVLGRSSPFSTEVNHDYCEANRIPVIRRCSGGQSIVTGPGCLMYGLLLGYQQLPELRMLDVAHQYVMKRMQAALLRIGLPTEMRGTCDLTFDDRKFSGNSLRCKKSWLLYHGTFICDLDLGVVADCLGKPKRQPEYRKERKHREFLTQLPVTTSDLKLALWQEWGVGTDSLAQWPESMTQELVQTKYRNPEWTRKVL